VVAQPNTSGYITAYPTAQLPNLVPLEATLTWSTPVTSSSAAATIVSNSAIVPAGINGGSVTVVCGGGCPADLVIDINGYFSAPTDGNSVTALGFQSFFSTNPSSFTTPPAYDVGVGDRAGYSNTTGTSNTFLGSAAGYYNTSGSFNTATGAGAGGSGTPGSNSMFGYNAGYNNNGGSNSFFGRSTGFNSTTGSYNTFLGSETGYNNNTGNYNTYVGYSVGVNSTGSSNLYLANPGTANLTENNTIRIGSKGNGTSQHSSVFVEPILLNPTTLTSVVTIDPSNLGKLGYTTLPTIPGGGNVSTTSALCPVNPLNFITKWTASLYVDCSHIWENSTSDHSVGIGTTIPLAQLDVASGDINVGNSPILHHYQIGNSTVLSIDGGFNVLVGVKAGQSNTGSDATFVGYGAGMVNTGNANTALGMFSGVQNSAGIDNTFVGYYAGQANQTGNNNVCLGVEACASVSANSNNTMIGSEAGNGLVVPLGNSTIGNNNIYLGYYAGPLTATTESNTIRIGVAATGGQGTPSTDTYIAGIYGSASAGPSNVVCVASNGKLFSASGGCPATSSRRFKEQILDMGDSSSRLLQLRPVTFLYKPEYDDGSHSLQYGLIAEEVAKVFPDMVVYGKDGQPEALKYQLLAPMLLNELQKQNAQIQSQAQAIQEQQEQNRKLEDRLAALEALLAVKAPAGGAQR
jgi:hypothetical protein